MGERVIFINGRFLAQPVTGVQRFAIEVLKALDGLIARGEVDLRGRQIEILAPPEVCHRLPLHNIKVRQAGRLKGNLWEQFDLPWQARSGLLVGLCNINPVLHLRQVITLHDASVFAVPEAYSPAFRLKYQLVLRIVGRTARRVITVSNFSKAELIRFCGIQAGKVTVISEGSEHILAVPPDDGVFAKHAFGARPYVLAVGSNSPHKNYAGLLQAAGLLAAEPFDFVFAGGTFGSVFRTRQVGLPANVHTLGYVSDAELRALYQRADCFVYPTFYEGFGLPPLEAMRVGCPVVVSRSAALPEVCGEAALYVDPHRPEEIAAQIVKARQPDVQQELRARGLQQAARFSWKNTACGIWAIIEACLGKPGAVKEANA
jgi:glycosyltransferase involved in cell wall biosynthesis